MKIYPSEVFALVSQGNFENILEISGKTQRMSQKCGHPVKVMSDKLVDNLALFRFCLFQMIDLNHW